MGGPAAPEANGRAQRTDGTRAAVLQVTHIGGLARLVRLAAVNGDEDAVAVSGVLYVRPPQGGDFRPSTVIQFSPGVAIENSSTLC